MIIILTKKEILNAQKTSKDPLEKIISKIIADKLKEIFPYNCQDKRLVKNDGTGHHNFHLPKCIENCEEKINLFKTDCIEMMQKKNKQCSLSLLGGWHGILTKWML